MESFLLRFSLNIGYILVINGLVFIHIKLNIPIYGNIYVYIHSPAAIHPLIQLQIYDIISIDILSFCMWYIYIYIHYIPAILV